MSMFDKQIHKDDFRLRLLVTNKCNKNCDHCLNDFQVKGNDFLDNELAITIIEAYCKFMNKKKLKPAVEISGGEPGLYPSLTSLIIHAYTYGASVKVNTNGLALHTIPSIVRDKVDCWHVGVTDCDENILYDIEEVGGQAQYVVKFDRLICGFPAIVHFYRHVPLKLFVDFYEKGEDKKIIEDYIETFGKMYPNIKTRYTGIQENRGRICTGCKRKCITLKALWVFPDGTMSLCPQHRRKIHIINPDFMPDMETLYNQHNFMLDKEPVFNQYGVEVSNG